MEDNTDGDDDDDDGVTMMGYGSANTMDRVPKQYCPKIMYIMYGIPFMEWYRIMVEATVDVTEQPK